MRSTLAKLGVLLSLLILAAFVVFLINQTAQVVELAERVHPTFAQGLLWFLIFLFVACAVVPLVLILRLPKPLTPPGSEDSPELEAHLKALGRRLASNPAVASTALSSRAQIEDALGKLELQSDRLTRAAASQVFVTTAISQNGSLDAVLVLAAQTRLIWRVAHLYYQRPTIRDMLYLYANVASTAFIASSLEEIDIAEQLEPVLAAGFGSVASAVPGTSLLVSSLATGAANAFLTLRVGIIARNYCGAVVLPPKGVLRRSAAVAAAKMLSSVTAEGAGKVSSAFWRASRNRIGGMVGGVGDRVEGTWDWVKGKVRRSGPEEPEPEGA